MALQPSHVWRYSIWERTLMGILSLKLKKLLNLLFELKITCSLQNGKFLEMNLLSLVLRLSDCFPKKGKQILSYFWGTVNTTFLATKILSRNTLTQRSVENPGKAFFRKISFKNVTSAWNLFQSQQKTNARCRRGKNEPLFIRIRHEALKVRV